MTTTPEVPDTLLIDGEPLPSYVCLEWPYEWPYQAVRDEGDVLTFPGIDGGESPTSLYAPGVLPVPLAIYDDADCPVPLMAPANERFFAVRAAMKPGREVLLTRVFGLPGDTTEEHEARAKFLGMNVSRPSVEVTRAVAEFSLLDGVWYGPEETVEVDGTLLPILGETRTNRMVITITGGAPPITLRNLTNGWALTYTGTSNLVLDNESMVATTGNPAKLTWRRRLPFRLDPGDNEVLITGGASASITYRPAYL